MSNAVIVDRSQGCHSVCPWRSQEIHLGEWIHQLCHSGRWRASNQGICRSSHLLTQWRGQEQAPAYSHQSLGAREGWHTQLFSHLRLLRLQVSEQSGIPISEITTDHPNFPWMVKHVGFTHNRFQLGQD
eukprot:3356714-Amphidinium_carterae.3